MTYMFIIMLRDVMDYRFTVVNSHVAIIMFKLLSF